MNKKQAFIYVIGLVTFGYYLGLFLKIFSRSVVSVLAKRDRQKEGKEGEEKRPYRVRYNPVKAN